MAVAFDAVGTAFNSINGASSPQDNTSLTVGAGANRGLVAQVVFVGAAPAGTTVTWDPAGTNQALTLIKTAASVNGQTTQLYGLVAPTSGNKTLRVAWTTGTSSVMIQGVSWTGVDQTGGVTSFPHSTSATGNSSAASVAVTSAVGNAVMSCTAAGTLQVISSVSATQTFLLHGNGNYEAGGSRAAGAATVTVTGTYAGTDQWVIIGTDILASGGAAVDTQEWFPRSTIRRNPDTSNVLY